MGKTEPNEEKIVNIDEIVIKRPKSVKSPEPVKKLKENFIPSGLNNLPRTPFIGNTKNDADISIQYFDESPKHDTSKNQKKTKLESAKSDTNAKNTSEDTTQSNKMNKKNPENESPKLD